MATFPSWKDAVAQINAVIGPPSTEQIELAQHVGLKLKRNEPSVLLAGRLRTMLSNPLHLDNLSPSATLLIALEDTCRSVGRRKIPSPDSNAEARAWITYLRLKQRRDSLRKLKLSSGDLVASNLTYSDWEVREVASIREDGCVYFRGGEDCGLGPTHCL